MNAPHLDVGLEILVPCPPARGDAPARIPPRAAHPGRVVAAAATRPGPQTPDRGRDGSPSAVRLFRRRALLGVAFGVAGVVGVWLGAAAELLLLLYGP